MNLKYEYTNKDFLPDDENKEGQLPPMADEWFDGEKEQTKVKFNKCKHQLEIVSSTEAMCTRCSVGYFGSGIADLVKASHLKRSR